MISYVITIKGHEYSEACAQRCIDSADHEVKRFKAVDSAHALEVMDSYGLRWTWTRNTIRHCKKTGLRQHPYGELVPKIGCSMSHYLLWRKCVTEGPLLILEHDSVFLRPLPDIEHKGLCMINDPRGATHRGDWWSDQMAKRGPGVWDKTRVMTGKRPDGLAGNSAYLIKPKAAQQLIDAFHTYGVWPNDATMCIQLFPYLQELYPFVTRVAQTQSTSGA